MIMKAEIFAELLNENEYGNEITNEQCEFAKEHGLVVVFGASDDLCEFRGAIEDEASCYDGGKIVIFKNKKDWNVWDADAIDDLEDSRKEVAALDAVAVNQTIDAIWCPDEPQCSWIYKTDIPHSTFRIMEDGELYCMGIVFAVDSLK